MKNLLYSLSVLLFLSSCSQVKQISTNTEKSEQHLQKIVVNTTPNAQNPTTSPKDTLDLLYKRINLSEIYATNVIWDTTYSIDNNWFKFNIKSKPYPNQILEYKGFIHVANPNLLYIKSANSYSINNSMAVDTSKQKAKLFPSLRTVSGNSFEWQKILIAANGSFEGFRIDSRNLNFVNMQNFNFNNSCLSKDTLRGSFAISSNQLELTTNTFKNTYFLNTLMSFANFKNWHFTGEQFMENYWNFNKIYDTEFNDVVMRNIGIYDCLFQSCILRNTNYGSFNDVRFSKTQFLNPTIENLKMESCDFNNCTMYTGNIRNSEFKKVRFFSVCHLQAMTLQGKFINCEFGQNVTFSVTTFIDSDFDGGKFDKVDFFQETCYFKNCTFKDVYFVDVKFAGTGFLNVKIGDPNAGAIKKVMARCDFSTAKWDTQTTFYNIDFQGCIFNPGNLNGVTFIGCKNAPK